MLQASFLAAVQLFHTISNKIEKLWLKDMNQRGLYPLDQIIWIMEEQL